MATETLAGDTARCNITLPRPLLDAVDCVIDRGWWKSRAAFVRQALREAVAREVERYSMLKEWAEKSNVNIWLTVRGRGEVV